MRLIYCSVIMCVSSFAFSQPLIEWQKCFGGTMLDGPAEVQQTTDGGYFIAGYTSSNDGDVIGYHAGEGAGLVYDAWMVKLDSDGNLEWQK
ncbi:MAG: T9SS C-terminal target domain-containing protein, partial [Flavobacteriales bacterium]